MIVKRKRKLMRASGSIFHAENLNIPVAEANCKTKAV